MSNSNRRELSQRFWLTSQIGWLSVCIIAVAWGDRLLPSQFWENIWGAIGVFGLASALGLSSVAAARAAHDKRTLEGGD